MASAILRDELLCSICLNTFADPVTLRCGHNFCRVCIDQLLKTQDGSGVYSCPECRAEFQERPALQRNINLHNVAERLLSTRPHQEKVTGIFCTYCINSSVPAVKSCLLCEASLCDDHLNVHSKSPEHVLIDPSTSLENRKCSVHKKILEYYCTKDAACICVYCLAEEHREHQVEKLDEALNKKNKKLRNILQKLITEREKTEERVQSLEESWRKAQEKLTGEGERVIALFIDIRRWLDDLEKRVLSEISRQEVQVSLSLSDVIHKLEIKKDELSKKMRHIEELCNMTDPLTILQDLDTGDLCDPEEGGEDEDTGEHDKTHDVDVDVITGMLHVGFSDIMTNLPTISPTKPNKVRPRPPNVRCLPSYTQASPVSGTEYVGDGVIGRTGGEAMAAIKGRQGHLVSLSDVMQNLEKKKEELSRKMIRVHALHSSGKKYLLVRTGGEGAAAGKGNIYGQGPADILLDVNTAANNLLISDDLKTVTWTNITQNRPETAERFESYQVMSRRRFTSGRHYWDVEISGSARWRVGMCYPSIDRRGGESYFGYNTKSWCLCREQGLFSMFYNNFSVTHGSKWIQLRHQISSDRFRICLDYEAGQLSFYELCDPIRHLHTCTATFTEPLHAAVYVGGGSIKISGGNRI